MLPTHRPLTNSDLQGIGVVVTLMGFVGFTLSSWLLLWSGLDRKGNARRTFWWWVAGVVISYALILWGLIKA